MIQSRRHDIVTRADSDEYVMGINCQTSITSDMDVVTIVVIRIAATSRRYSDELRSMHGKGLSEGLEMIPVYVRSFTGLSVQSLAFEIAEINRELPSAVMVSENNGGMLWLKKELDKIPSLPEVVTINDSEEVALALGHSLPSFRRSPFESIFRCFCKLMQEDVIVCPLVDSGPLSQMVKQLFQSLEGVVIRVDKYENPEVTRQGHFIFRTGSMEQSSNTWALMYAMIAALIQIRQRTAEMNRSASKQVEDVSFLSRRSPLTPDIYQRSIDVIAADIDGVIGALENRLKHLKAAKLCLMDSGLAAARNPKV